MAIIAALGTGVMGAPMARNLARAGNEVRAWNRTVEKVAEAAERYGADLPAAEAIAERFTQATDAGYGDEDMAVTHRLSRPR